MILDPDDPFFAPRWRRYAVVAISFGWAAVEWWNGAPRWAAGFALAGAFAAWMLLLRPLWRGRAKTGESSQD